MNFINDTLDLERPFVGDRKGPKALSPKAQDHRNKSRTRGLLSGAELKSGYVANNPVLDDILNRSLAVFLILFVSPIFLMLTAAQLIFVRGSIFYSGDRYGKDKEIFKIYKFRTLNTIAQKLTNNKTLPSDSMTETALGPYLRYSRLDELPQLWNIVKGDMVFFGPRPTRPEMESQYINATDSYEIRFKVKPGLVGLSQAVMGHETSKRTRARFNRMCCKAPVNYGFVIVFVVRVGLAVLKRGFIGLRQAVGDIMRLSPERKWTRTGFYSPKKSFVKIEGVDGISTGVLTGISGNHLQFISSKLFEKGQHEVVLERQVGKRKVQVKATLNIADGYPVGIRASGFLHFGHYRLNSSTADYKVERYFVCTPLLSR